MKSLRRRVRVQVPATTANLGPGYDVLGLSLDFYNEVDLAVDPADGRTPPLRIEIEGQGAATLPADRHNAIWKAMESVFRAYKLPLTRHRFRLRLTNRIPLARGMGSSAAARLSGILAANAACSRFLSQEEVIDRATAMEGHPDNVVPAMAGGLCASLLEGGRVRFIRLDPPAGLKAVVCVPAFELSTKKARSVLPARIAHGDAVYNVSRVAMLLAAFSAGDYSALRSAMDDRLHQPYRRKLVPGFDQVLKNAYGAGAAGAALSGAGPSVLALAAPSRARAVAAAMEKAFARAGRPARSLVLNFCKSGARIG